MKKIFFLFLTVMLAAGIASCNKVVGEGPVVTQDRTATGFSSIESYVSINVYYTEGTEYKVQLVGQQNILDLIETQVTGSALKILYNRDNVNIKSGKELKIIITSPAVNAIHISGSATLTVTDDFKPQNFDLSLSGSGNANIESITTGNLNASISGSGHIKINNGSADNADLDISGSGEINMAGLTAKNAVSHSSGSGNVKVWATDKLEVHISGSGHVYYKGSPDLDTDISGSGGVSKLD